MPGSVQTGSWRVASRDLFESLRYRSCPAAWRRPQKRVPQPDHCRAEVVETVLRTWEHLNLRWNHTELGFLSLCCHRRALFLGRAGEIEPEVVFLGKADELPLVGELSPVAVFQMVQDDAPGRIGAQRLLEQVHQFRVRKPARPCRYGLTQE